jgi:wyosine [tRNA(Phe)-imidazoG37] synthetase (radical SAM superfamily)
MISDEAASSPPLVFGPVPSRRLGRSIGINNIPPKVCSYACVYCQIGPTVDRRIQPQPFYEPESMADDVARHVAHVRSRGEDIDYLTFVPDGEPTLDVALGDTIRLLRPLGIDIAVITNGSLLWRTNVREALGRADWVSVKVDAADPHTWRRINRPHPGLTYDAVCDGIARFAESYEGDLVSETMLVAGINDAAETVRSVGRFLSETGFATAYLSIPTRPTPYAGISAPDEQTVSCAYHVLAEHVAHVEQLVGYEGDAFASGGDPRADLLSITAVHPMRASAVRAVLDRTGADWSVVERLIADGELIEASYRTDTFYVRRFAAARRDFPPADERPEPEHRPN